MTEVWKPHATAGAVIEQDGRFLVVEELIQGRPVFNQPAGHLEDRESFQQAVVREVLEETGYRFQPEHVIGIYRWRNPVGGNTHVRVSFAGKVLGKVEHAQLDSGIIAPHWLTRDQLIQQPSRLRSSMVMRCIDDYIAGRRFPLDLLVDVP